VLVRTIDRTDVITASTISPAAMPMIFCLIDFWNIDLCPAEASAHASRHEAARFRMTVLVVGPNHRSTRAIWSVDHSFSRNIDPLTTNAHAIVTILAFPIGVVYALRITAIAARPLSATQALIPRV